MFSLNYRPFKLEEVIGNKGTISEMKKRSLTRDFPEVMIFAGPSGTGKTTLAFIIAALVNEHNPVEGEDCLNPNPESPSSKSILSERFDRDVHFFDASSMSKDDVLRLEDIVSSSPMFDAKKVIIIDEAQELSKASKGATLRLLEKKRRNSHIILCTMNLSSFDAAVKSRGQLYTFYSPGSLEISKHLFNILEKEEADVPDSFLEEGLFILSENSEGSVRLALQNLERCLTGGFFTAEQIATELGLISSKKLTELIWGVLNKDPKVVPEIIKFSSQEFLYKTVATLTSAYVYNETGFVDAEWKSTFASKLKTLSYIELLEELRPVTEKYFNESLLLYTLVKFISKKDPSGVPKRVRIPV